MMGSICARSRGLVAGSQMVRGVTPYGGVLTIGVRRTGLGHRHLANV